MVSTMSTDGSVTTILPRTLGGGATGGASVGYGLLTQRWIESQTDTDAVEAQLEERFQGLAEEWRRDTQLESSVSRIAMHPSYQRIIAMGQRAIRFILRDLQRHPDHWFWALRTIAGESPVPPEAQGNIRLMAQAWLDWGRNRGHLGKTVIEARSMSDTASVPEHRLLRYS